METVQRPGKNVEWSVEGEFADERELHGENSPQ
jgi:hypothetical protein